MIYINRARVPFLSLIGFLYRSALLLSLTAILTFGFSHLLHAGPSLTIAWDDMSSNEAGFKIERKVGLRGTYAQIAIAGANTTKFTDVYVLLNTPYYYRVRAFNSSGNSAYSNEAYGAIVSAVGALAASSTTLTDAATTATVSATQIQTQTQTQTLSAAVLSAQEVQLEWSGAADAQAEHTVERKSADDTDYVAIANVDAGVTVYTDDSVTADRVYFYRLRHAGEQGEALYSNEATATTSVPADPSDMAEVPPFDFGEGSIPFPPDDIDQGDLPPPPAPEPPSSSGSGSTNTGFVGVDTVTQGNWNGAHGHDGYYLINDTASTPAYVQISPYGQGDWVWNWSTTDVRALQKASLSERLAAAWSSASSFTVNLTFTDNQVHRVGFYCVDWDSNDRVQSIEVLDAGTGALLDSQTLSTFHPGAYLMWNLQNSVQMRFSRIAGLDAVLSGIFFDSIETTSAAPPPQESISLTATLMEAGFPVLTWSHSFGNRMGFRLERLNNDTGTFELMASVGADVASYTDTAAAPGATYVYRVSVAAAVGAMAFSNEASVTTPAEEVAEPEVIVPPVGDSVEPPAPEPEPQPQPQPEAQPPLPPLSSEPVEDAASPPPAVSAPAAPAAAAPPPIAPAASEAVSLNDLPIFTAVDFNDCKLGRVEGLAGQQFLIQTSQDQVTWRALHIVVITQLGFSLVVIDAAPGPTYYRAVPLK